MVVSIQMLSGGVLDVNRYPKYSGRGVSVRKSREEAAQTRKRIVTAAAGEFRKNGIVATGLNDLMKAAGLTHGGFYKHFESKDQLVAEAFAEAVETMIEFVRKAVAGGASVVETYLSTSQRDNPAISCPLSAIGSELGRSDEKTRAIATDGFLKLVEIMADQFGDMTRGEARRQALVVVSTMIGALTMARVVTDPKLSAEILNEAKKSLAR
jgi:TetR/AcrR family transcriptional regulator, transcriptional repressor for nem operon